MADMHTEHGMRCPDCGQAERFIVDIQLAYPVGADGQRDFSKLVRFNGDNPACCDNHTCTEHGRWQTVGYFRAKVESAIEGEPTTDRIDTAIKYLDENSYDGHGEYCASEFGTRPCDCWVIKLRAILKGGSNDA